MGGGDEVVVGDFVGVGDANSAFFREKSYRRLSVAIVVAFVARPFLVILGKPLVSRKPWLSLVLTEPGLWEDFNKTKLSQSPRRPQRRHYAKVHELGS